MNIDQCGPHTRAMADDTEPASVLAASLPEPEPAVAEESLDLVAAVQRGAVARVRQLLDSGAEAADTADSAGVSLLHWAAINNQLEVAELLLDRSEQR